MKNPERFINADFPTVDDVVKLAMDPRWSYGVAIVPQARLLDFDLQPYVLPVPLDPNDPTALCSLHNGGYISDINTESNTTDDVHGKATFKLYEFPGIGQFNTLKNLVRVTTQYYKLEPSGPRLINEVPVGTYMFSIPDRTLLDEGNYWDITGHSLTQIVLDIGFENFFTIPAGANLVDSAKSMLMADFLPPLEGGREPTNACGRAGGCAGCPPADGTGTARGYCQQGYALTDPKSMSLPYGMSTVMRQRGATGFPGPVLYNTTIGMKIEASSGAPIDPWTCLPMKVEIVSPGDIGSAVPGEIVPGEMVIGTSGGSGLSFPAFITSKFTAAGNEMYLDTSTGKCYDSVTGDEVNPLTGNPATITTPVLFKSVLAGSLGIGFGDGGLAVARGNGAGYSPSFGWSVADTGHALTEQTAPGSQYYKHWVPEAGHNVIYLWTEGVTGLKITADSGHPIDPWNHQPMPYQQFPGQPFPDPAWAGDLFVISYQFGGQITYFNAELSQFYHWDGVQSAGHLTIATPDWQGVTPTPPETVFELAGGDGGISPIPPGAIGPQVAPVGAYVWPDPNNPGLTPSCCPHSGPNIPARRIITIPSEMIVIDPDTGKHVKGDPRTKNTLPFSPKDNQLKSINTLLKTAIYWPLYDDADGNFILMPQPYTDGVSPVSDPHFFYETAENGVIKPGIVQKLDSTAIANKVVARSENTKRAAITATGYNRSDDSYISIQNLGRVVQQQPALQLDTITDQNVLQLAVDVAVNLAALPGESLQMTVHLNPFLDVHDVLGLNVWSPDGKTLEISTNKNPFLVTSWKHDFAKRTTDLTLGRLVPL